MIYFQLLVRWKDLFKHSFHKSNGGFLFRVIKRYKVSDQYTLNQISAFCGKKGATKSRTTDFRVSNFAPTKITLLTEGDLFCYHTIKNG
jgi:hypothetical protein